MARYQVKGPDGLVHVFEGPDGASPDQVLQVAQSMFGQPSKAAQDTAAWQQTISPTNGMDTLDKVRAGMGKAFTDLARGAGQWTGLVSRQDIAQTRAQDAPLMATTAGKVGDIAGNIVPAALTAMIPGANTITGGALVGATLGSLQPSTSTKETLGNVGLGAAGGAVVPAAVKGYRIAKAAAEPFYESGQQAIVGRALNRAAGADAPAVAQRLQDASAPFVGPSQGVPRTTMGELVPGSVPTVGQASGNAGVASLERAATAVNPDVTNALDKTIKAQNAARVGELQDVAGTGGARDFFAAARDATANDLYGQARTAGIDSANLTPELVQQMQKLQQRIPQAVMDRAKEIATIKGEPLTDATSVSGLHYVKQAIDDLIGAADRSGNNTLKAAYTGLQKDLLGVMDQASPAYAGARQTYAAMSKPVNQMDVAQAIADKSVNKLSGNLQPNAYANALTDTTAARATGFPGATLENTLSPNQLNRLNMILQDVQRSSAAEAAGKGTGSDTVRKLAYSNLIDQSGVPTFVRDLAPAQMIGNIGSRFADAAYGRANAELSNRLAQVMLDPAEASRLMFAGAPNQQAANQLLLMLGRGGVGLGRAVLTGPAAANAQQ